MPGSETQQATDLLQATFPAQAGSSAMVVFHTADGTLADPDAAAAVERPPSPGSSSSRTSSRRSSSARCPLRTIGSRTSARKTALELGVPAYDKLKDALQPAQEAGVQVELGGEFADGR